MNRFSVAARKDSLVCVCVRRWPQALPPLKQKASSTGAVARGSSGLLPTAAALALPILHTYLNRTNVMRSLASCALRKKMRVPGLQSLSLLFVNIYMCT